MRSHRSILVVCALSALTLTLVATVAAETGKIPVTTSSEEARQAFLEGRQLAEALRTTDARPFYAEAVVKDPSFAWAHLGTANTSITTDEFWAALERAVEHAGQASDGERLLILAFNAGVHNEPEMQREYYDKLIEAYPEDERAQDAVANFHFGRQEYDQAIAHYTKAVEINPDFAPTYNSMGYTYRSLENFDAAEKAFQKYIELIPNEPNPYDSYAELLMKLGRFEESIENYEKALAADKNFTASLVGIGANYMHMSSYDKARDSFAKLKAQARDRGETRQALFWTAISYIYESKPDKAMEILRERYEVAKADDDLAAMAGDMNLMGTVLLESGQPDEAMAKYDEAAEMMARANVPKSTKEAMQRTHMYNSARVALEKGDVTIATSQAKAFREQCEAKGLPFLIRQSHQLTGMIALHEERYEDAVAELSQANQQNPMVLYDLGRAHNGAGAAKEAQKYFQKAAHHNELAAVQAYVRGDALSMLAEGASATK